MSTGLASLKRFIERPPPVEICELCSTRLAEQHEHVIQPRTRRILCACTACAILFDSGTTRTEYRRIPRDIRYLGDFQIDDGLWNSLMIPIGLVFFFFSSAANRIVAFYPSPAGATEAEVDPELWGEIVELNPVLRKMIPDTEALLANRVQNQREYYIAPIDECYRLTGLIRKHWSGFSGGSEAWDAIRDYFAGLKKRSAHA